MPIKVVLSAEQIRSETGPAQYDVLLLHLVAIESPVLVICPE